jgi:hypothetical protein
MIILRYTMSVLLGLQYHDVVPPIIYDEEDTNS